MGFALWSGIKLRIPALGAWSQSLDHQGSPELQVLLKNLSFFFSPPQNRVSPPPHTPIITMFLWGQLPPLYTCIQLLATGLLNLSITDISIQVILCCVCPLHCKMLSRIPGLFLPDISSITAQKCDSQRRPRILPNVPCGWRAKSLWIENHSSRSSRITQGMLAA